MTRLLFTTDLHGSTGCWRKCLTAIMRYKADVAIISGDLTAKAVVPIIRDENGTYTFKFLNKSYKTKKEEELKDPINKIKSYGFYPYICTKEEASALSKDREKLLKLFDYLAVQTMKEWLEIAEEKLGDKLRNGSLKLIIMPGNDDTFAIDEVIKENALTIYPLGRVVTVNETHEILSFDYVNSSPWQTPREAPEGELKKMLDEIFRKATNYEHLIFLCHCPPYDSGLDMAPKLDEKMRPVYSFGQPITEAVGSKAVREAVEKYQPKLGLFGHIHEAYGFVKIGRSLCLNPGSEYDRGILKAYVVEMSRDKIDRFWRIEG
ncbi:MAG: metallophosphoesterase [Candidatus Bathyarchaeia archaeon]